MDECDWERVLKVNLTGTYLCCRAAVGQMITQKPRGEVRGRIVNLSSQHGIIAAPADIAYGTTKAAVAYLTRQIATDHARPRHRLQRGGAGQNPDRRHRPCDRSRCAGSRASAD